MTVELIPLALIDPHPDNPRLKLRQDVIETIRLQIEASGFDEAHALLLRPLNGRYQTLNGHHRTESARLAGLTEVPAWVREYSDEDAFMQLVLANVQSSLTPIERGRHALRATVKYGANGGISIAKYADLAKRKENTVRDEYRAAEVFGESTDIRGLEKRFSQLVAIHPAPRSEWPALAKALVENNWTVEQTERAVREAIKRAKADTEPPTVITLDDWKSLKAKQRIEVLNWRERSYQKQFNRQDTDSIEWAQQSWNPVTGCLHNCPYCYARDIAERLFPEGFNPALHIDRLVAPYQTPLPQKAAGDLAYRNVFTCSMADLFGKWVPTEWIEAVLAVVRDNPQWNFLFLTKFPIRMSEFEYPENAWLGTTVDLQARVKNAERAMAKVKAAVKWVSIEPLLEPIHMDWSLFQWVVIGGASASTQTPDWKPPRDWVWDLTFGARQAGCLVYHKTNLNNERLREFPGQHEAEAPAAPEVFHYLKVVG